MWEKDERSEEEKKALCTLAEVEDLAEKKAMIHSRLLMDTALAKTMEELSKRHENRKERLCVLGLGKAPKKKNEGGMSALSGQDKENEA